MFASVLQNEVDSVQIKINKHKESNKSNLYEYIKNLNHMSLIRLLGFTS